MTKRPKNLDKALKNYFREVGIGMDSARFTLGTDTAKPLSHRDGLTTLLDLLVGCRSEGNQVIFIGNGGSAAICSHMAIDFMNAGKMRAMDFNSGPLITCLANDYGFENFFAKAIEVHGRKNDIVVAISSSGRSDDILRGVAAAKNLGCQAITLSGFNENNPLSLMGDINVYVPTTKYGEVEVAHYFILHFLLDCLAKKPPLIRRVFVLLNF